ncbi:MAG TPA: SRPBCC family protein [Burkholderiales bacterium]|jgi:uncharacterized protein YndB with AHSA1/START domain
MSKATFVYVTYIRATPERVFQALTDGQITRQYWGHENVSDWQPGSTWRHQDAASGNVRILGEVLESKPPHRLVISWAFSTDAGDKAKRSRVAFDIGSLGDMVKLTVTHDDLEPGSEMDHAIREGWPRVLSSLKTLLETGKALDTWAGKGER